MERKTLYQMLTSQAAGMLGSNRAVYSKSYGNQAKSQLSNDQTSCRRHRDIGLYDVDLAGYPAGYVTDCAICGHVLFFVSVNSGSIALFGSRRGSRRGSGKITPAAADGGSNRRFSDLVAGLTVNCANQMGCFDSLGHSFAGLRVYFAQLGILQTAAAIESVLAAALLVTL